ncbi:uncharacterized protein JNUCC1_03477 [Lentibacillus sp. JNUCC-1]|uniref:sporulation protein YqfC n=1 Tax=Lentibacillus sp. JNUCC-1 TaxID=2654513 RepID=UPI0012E85DB3|nr:sporulation protein YqfC [Lentibacillus sp. JNUCC-1]MUV39599.1 uncharacterized protein [Lentibacillus sp. JNUCC-1]
MKKWQQFKPWLNQHLDLPSDTLLEVPRITAIGQFHVYIENHKGLILYTDQKLVLKSDQGEIQITGQGFVIKMMLPEELLLEGQIESIQFIETP